MLAEVTVTPTPVRPQNYHDVWHRQHLSEIRTQMSAGGLSESTFSQFLVSLFIKEASLLNVLALRHRLPQNYEEQGAQVVMELEMEETVDAINDANIALAQPGHPLNTTVYKADPKTSFVDQPGGWRRPSREGLQVRSTVAAAMPIAIGTLGLRLLPQSQLVPAA